MLSTGMITRQHQTLIQQSLAQFSDCEQYRYWLRRDWDADLPAISFLMLNPSTADEVANDPTIERCQRRAIAMGYGSMIIVNLFSFRLTDSTQLDTVADLLGDQQAADACIVRAVQLAEMTVCGWGKHALAAPRAQHVLALLKAAGLQHKVKCLQLNKDGSPQHPLYIAYTASPVAFDIH